VRGVSSFLSAVGALFEQRSFNRLVQPDQAFGAVGDAAPQHLRPPRGREGSYPRDAERERRFVAGGGTHHPAHVEQLAVVQFAQEQQGDVQVGRLHPLHVGPARRERRLQVGGPAADVAADVEADKRSSAWHGVEWEELTTEAQRHRENKRMDGEELLSSLCPCASVVQVLIPIHPAWAFHVSFTPWCRRAPT
jgi:hypothetical protein